MDTTNLIIIFTGISFLVYGVNSFYSNKMISEFERWGLKERRKIIACFQLLCGSLLIIGIKHNLPFGNTQMQEDNMIERLPFLLHPSTEELDVCLYPNSPSQGLIVQE